MRIRPQDGRSVPHAVSAFRKRQDGLLPSRRLDGQLTRRAACYNSFHSSTSPLSPQHSLSCSDASQPSPLKVGRSRRLVWWASAAVGASAAGTAIVLAREGTATGTSSGARSEQPEALVSVTSAVSKLSSLSFHRAASAFEHSRQAVGHAADALQATAVLLQCLASVLVASGSGGVQARDGWWAPQVTATVADFAANDRRRKGVATAGNGKVVQWLLGSVSGQNASLRLEAERALASLLLDGSTCRAVLCREGGVKNLLEFACTADQFKSHKDSEAGGQEWPSPLVDAIMELVTSSDPARDWPLLGEQASEEDIAAALTVLQNGEMDAEEELPPYGRKMAISKSRSNCDPQTDGARESEDLRRHRHGLELAMEKLLAGSAQVSVPDSLSGGFRGAYCEPRPASANSKNQALSAGDTGRQKVKAETSRVSIGALRTKKSKWGEGGGLWDDLPGKSVAVVLAAWALATWTHGSPANRAKIAELDPDGTALQAAALAPERSVRCHVASAASTLIRRRAGEGDSWAEAVGQCWCEPLLMSALSAGQQQDSELARCALGAVTACVENSSAAQTRLVQAGLGPLRQLAGQQEDDQLLQQALATTLRAVAARKGSAGLPLEEGKQWCPILLGWACGPRSCPATRAASTDILEGLLQRLGQSGLAISQAWLAKLLMELVEEVGTRPKLPQVQVSTVPGQPSKKGALQGQIVQGAAVATAQLAKVVAQEAAAAARQEWQGHMAADLLGTGGLQPLPEKKDKGKDFKVGVSPQEAVAAVGRAVKAMTELVAEDPSLQGRVLGAGGLPLLRHLLLGKEYDLWLQDEKNGSGGGKVEAVPTRLGKDAYSLAHVRKHALRLLNLLATKEDTWQVLAGDPEWVDWLDACADGQVAGNKDMKSRSFARSVLLQAAPSHHPVGGAWERGDSLRGEISEGENGESYVWPRYGDYLYLMDPGHPILRQLSLHPADASLTQQGVAPDGPSALPDNQGASKEDPFNGLVSGLPYASVHQHQGAPAESPHDQGILSSQVAGGGPASGGRIEARTNEGAAAEVLMDVVFVHGLCGGPFKTWRMADSSQSTLAAAGLLENVDADAGKAGTCWPGQWLNQDLPSARSITVKYKTNLSEWKGATLPLQEISGILLEKLWDAGVGQRPVVFVCHSMGGLIVKQILAYAQEDPRYAQLLHQTRGTVFYSTPHWGSKLADMPWRMGLVLRPAPSVEDLRSSSPRLLELNRTLKHLHQKGQLDVLSFSETLLSPIVKAYGGIALRMEVVPIESAYPGFGDIVVLEGTDHVNSCKPRNRNDVIYTKTLVLLQSVQTKVLQERQKKRKDEEEARGRTGS